MDIHTAQSYWNAIDTIEAGEVLLDFTIHDYPNLKDDKRKELFKKFESRLNSVRKSDSKKVTNKELMQLLSRR
jgi:hypothetical protein